METCLPYVPGFAESFVLKYFLYFMQNVSCSIGFFYLFKLFLCLLQKHHLWFYVNYLLLLENVSLEEWTEILFHPKTEEWGFVPIIGFSLEEIMIFVLRVLEQISTWKTLFIVNALQNMMLSSCNSVPGWLEINSTIPALCLSISIVNKAFFVSM